MTTARVAPVGSFANPWNSTTMDPSVDIIIVNWNSGRQLADCLESIATKSREGVALHRVVVVDNASTDQSAEGLERLLLPLVLLRNNTNRGFAAACNQGAKGSRAAHLLFLNPDVRLFDGSLSQSIAFMQNPLNAAIGMCGIQLVEEHGDVSRSCARFPTPGTMFARMLGIDVLFPRFFPPHLMTDWDHADSRPVDQVMGAFLLVRTPLFEDLGGFDERFFVYYEDLDFALRARRAGQSSYYFTGARAFHKGNGTTDQIKATRLVYNLQSRILFCYKHFNRGAATALTLGTLLVEPIARLTLAAARRSLETMKETLEGYCALWREAPRLFREGTKLGSETVPSAVRR